MAGTYAIGEPRPRVEDVRLFLQRSWGALAWHLHDDDSDDRGEGVWSRSSAIHRAGIYGPAPPLARSGEGLEVQATGSWLAQGCSVLPNLNTLPSYEIPDSCQISR